MRRDPVFQNKIRWAVILLLIPKAARAAPTIATVSGSFTPGAAVTVVGSGFGSHGDFGRSEAFLSAAWNDFEAGQFNAGNLGLDPQNASPTAPYQWSIQTAGGRTAGGRYAQKIYVDNELGELAHVQTGTTGRWFVSFWVRLDEVAEQQSGKHFRIYGSDSNAYLSSGGGNLDTRGFSECGSCSPAPSTVWGSRLAFRPNQWHRVDIEISETPDLFAVYLDSALNWRKSSTLPSLVDPASGDQRQQWVPAPFGGDGHTVGIGGMLDGPSRGYPTNGFYHFDDFFVDYTWARVELGNAPTWGQCTVKEIQIPTIWADGAVTVAANPGGFSPGQTAYLYVVDGTGAVNANGFPVIVGGPADATPPAAPKGLTVR